jgi:hypothetical protein
MCFTKLSILVFYLRVFPARRERWLSWGTIVFVILFTIPMLIGDVLQCNPITHQSFFNPGVVCLTPTPFLIASTVLHTVTDGWLILMVIPVVLTLRIPFWQKCVLMGVLSLGVFFILFSILRITSILRTDGRSDVTWILAGFDIWSILEVAIGLICACAPTIRPLLQKIFPNFLTSRISSTARTNLTMTGQRISEIELGAQNLEAPRSFASRIGACKKASWLSESVEEERMVLKQGRMVRRTGSVDTDIYGMSKGLSKSFSEADSLGEGVSGMLQSTS